MKTHNKSIVKSLAVLLALVPVLVFAQPNEAGPNHERGQRGQFEEKQGEGKFDQIPGLTEDQEAQIKKIRTNAQTDILPMRNQVNELEAKLQSLQTAKTADMKAINECIDKIAQTNASIEKRRALAYQDVRKLLNDEQRLFVDTHFHQGKGGHHGRGPKG